MIRKSQGSNGTSPLHGRAVKCVALRQHRQALDALRNSASSRSQVSRPLMSTLYLSHPASLNHLTPPGHPERPDRIRAIETALEKERFGARSANKLPWPRWRASSSPTPRPCGRPSGGLPAGGPRPDRRGHGNVAGHVRGRIPGRRRRRQSGRRGDDGRRRQRVRGDAAAGPSCGA